MRLYRKSEEINALRVLVFHEDRFQGRHKYRRVITFAPVCVERKDAEKE